MPKRKPRKSQKAVPASQCPPVNIEVITCSTGGGSSVLGFQNDVDIGINELMEFIPQKSHPVFMRLRQCFSRDDGIKLFAYAQIARRFIEMPSIPWEDRLICLLARWNIMNELLYLESRFENPHGLKSVESIISFVNEIMKDEEDIWNYIANFAVAPEVYPIHLKEKLHLALSTTAFLYGIMPGRYAFKLAFISGLSPAASERRWEDSLSLYKRAISGYLQLHHLLSRLLEQRRTEVQIPEHSGSALTQPNFAIQALCEALKYTKKEIDDIHLAFMFNAQLPHTSPFIVSFAQDWQLELYDASSNPLLTIGLFVKLVIVIRNYPEISKNPDFYSSLKDWLGKPETLSKCSEFILQAFSYQFKALSNSSKLITDSLSSSTDFALFKAYNEFQKVLLFFFDMFETSPNAHEMSFCNGVVFDLWRYHLGCIELIDLRNLYHLDEFDRSTFRQLRKNFFETFYRINGRLVTILDMTLKHEQLDELIPDKNKEILLKIDDCILKTLRIFQFSLIETVLENNTGNAELLLQHIELLTNISRQRTSKQNASYLTHLLEDSYILPGYSFTEARVIINAPPSPCLQLARTLHFTVNTLLNVSELAAPKNLVSHDVNVMIDAANALIKDLPKAVFLADIAGKVEKLALKLSHGILSGSFVHRQELSKRLASILELCLKRTNPEIFDHFILKNALEMLQAHVIKIKNSTYGLLVEFFSPKVGELMISLEDPSSYQIQKPVSDSSFNQSEALERNLQSTVFLELLEKEMQRKKKWEHINFRLFAKVFGHLTQSAGSDQLQNRFLILFVAMFEQQKCINRADLVERYTALHDMFLAIPLQGDLVKNIRLKKTFLKILDIFCKEALHWFEEGESCRAEIVLGEVNALWNVIREVSTPDEVLHTEQSIKNMYGVISSQKNYSDLLTFLKNPQKPNFVEHDYLPPAKGTSESNNLLEKFQAAWYALSFNSGLIKSKGDAREVYQAWFAQFGQCRVKKTKDMLCRFWTEHYYRFPDNTPYAQTSDMPQKKSMCTVESKPIDLPETKKIHTPLKFSRLQEIEQYNKKSMEKSLKPKVAKPRRGVGKKGRKTRIDASTSSAAFMDNHVIAESTPVHDVQNTGLAETTPTQTDGERSLPYPVTFLSSPKPKVKTQYINLPKGYQNSDFVQQIIETIERAGYQAYIYGGFVRDTLLGLNPKDVDLVTNCPPDILMKLFDNIDKSKTYDDVFHITDPHAKGLVIDITCRKGDTFKELVSTCDFTVHCFGITSKNKLLVPYPQSIKDLNQRKLKTIIEFKKSIETDPVRLFRLIRLSNQLGWELCLPEVNAIPEVRSYLKSVPLLILIKHLRKCFPQNINIAVANLDSFLKFNLFPAIFGVKPSQESLPVELSDFIKRAFLVIASGNEYEFIEDFLAISSLTLLNSAPKIIEHMKAWIHLAVPEKDMFKARILMTVLPKKIELYHKKSPLIGFNPNASSFDPVEELKLRMESPAIQQVVSGAYSFFDPNRPCVVSSSCDVPSYDPRFK
ncbi:CCA tRNA nucleotidyltransferase [Legionella worsleiensis]|nr:CCA tRNA nucleotidyltransferase [Legionella worsleiensis]